MQSIPPGVRGSYVLRVESRHLASTFKDSMLPPVFSTPYLILIMENAALNAVKAYLEAGESAVGTHVDVRHLTATPVGREVTGHAEVTGSDGRRIFFRVWATDGYGGDRRRNPRTHGRQHFAHRRADGGEVRASASRAALAALGAGLRRRPPVNSFSRQSRTQWLSNPSSRAAASLHDLTCGGEALALPPPRDGHVRGRSTDHSECLSIATFPVDSSVTAPEATPWSSHVPGALERTAAPPGSRCAPVSSGGPTRAMKRSTVSGRLPSLYPRVQRSCCRPEIERCE